MPQKKTKRPARKGAAKRTVTRVRKAAGKASKSAKKTATAAAKKVKKAASNPKRTVRKAADNVHQTAGKARNLGQNVIQAGELLTETAEFVDSMAQRAKARTQQGGTRSRRR